MRDFGNDILHILIAIVILGTPRLGWWGYIASGFVLGWLIETKEENSNITKVPIMDLSFRDWIGYIIGGLICGLCYKFITW
jgi:hypothetical protein